MKIYRNSKTGYHPSSEGKCPNPPSLSAKARQVARPYNTIILLIIVLALVGAGFYFWKHHAQKTPPSTVAVTQGDITEKAQAIGYIQPQHSITVKSQIDGTVDQIYHDEGEFVKVNEPLIRIKPAPAPATYAETYAALEQAKAQEKVAVENLKRYVDALKTKLITPNYTDFLNAKNNYAEAHVARVLAEQKLALLDQGNTNVGGKVIANIVTSPISGYILYRNVDVGDPVISMSSAQASTALFSIANMSDLMFEGSIDEMDASKIKLNMPASVTVGALPSQKITGTVTRISLQSEQDSGSAQNSQTSPFNVSFKIEITKLQFPKDLTLRSGYSSTADINIQTKKNILMLPARVLHFDQDQTYVLLPALAGQTPQKQTVETGVSDGVNIEIKKGLSVGEKVLDQTPDNSNGNNAS